jgi:hypothetical protein
MQQATPATTSRPKQLRITSLVTATEKKRAERLAKALDAGSVSQLVKQLLKERHELYLKERKAKSLAAPRKGAKASRNLVSGNHVALAKPARKRRAGNSTTNGTKRATLKSAAKSRAVPVAARKSAGNRTRTPAKHR